MSDKFSTRESIEQGLKHLPDMEPPADLSRRIMAALPARKKSCFQRLRDRFAALVSLPVPVGPVLATAGIGIAFFGGMQIDRLLQGPEIPVAGDSRMVKEDPAMNADASFYLGRSLLASGRAEQALEAFSRAARMKPDDPRFVLWQGAALYALGDTRGERQKYRQVIAQRPDYLPARLNLAHNLLQSGRAEQARVLYEQVLQQDPTEKTALYNRALALHLDNDKDAETRAWQEFLDHYRTGVWAFRALDHLYDNEDFAFRSYPVGYRSVILNQERLLAPAGPEREHELRYLADQLALSRQKTVNIIVFKQDDEAGARETARSLRSSLLRLVGDRQKETVTISWFGEPESLELGPGKYKNIRQGVMIFAAPEPARKEESI